MSLDPVVFYINGFLKEAETQHLLAVTEDKFLDSMVYLPNGTSVVDKRYCTSKSAMIPHSDPVARCLDTRMKSLLGNIQHEGTEQLQLVRYGVGEEFVLHNDWLDNPRHARDPGGTERAYNRLASLFVYLEDDCVGGETYFPQVVSAAPTADGTKFSRTSNGEGLLVKPRRGNGVFWNTARMNGTGDERMYHSSLPVESGVKTGMNLFGLYFLDTPIAGQHNYDVDSQHSQFTT
ncbi:hypothetical protein MY11210_008476 [Beauveria gryllotalpidicola]